MKSGLQEIDWATAGAMLSREDSDKQAVFFSAFLKECRSWGTTHQVETQLADINSNLTEDERVALKMLSHTEGDE